MNCKSSPRLDVDRVGGRDSSCPEQGKDIKNLHGGKKVKGR